MIRYAVRCGQGHGFDGWFRSAGHFDAMIAAHQVECPICGATEVAKAPMAPSVPARAGKPAAEAGPPAAAPEGREALIAALRRHVETHSEYVGAKFVTEARAMHEGAVPERAIHGEAGLDEARKLLEEGVPIAPLPFRIKRKLN